MGTLFYNISNTKNNCQHYAYMYFYTSNSFTSILYKSVFFISETMNKEKFENYLRKKNLSKQTVKMYSTSVKRYFDYYTNMDKNSLLNYKEHCETHYKPSSANVQINSLNHYLEFIGKENLKLKLVRTQQIETGFVFLNRSGHQITREGICKGLRKYAVLYGIPPEVVYPHSFRHRFAKNFLEKYKDIALLADLMGHESIETTRIYLRMTAGEQYSIVNKVVTW